MPGTNNMAQEVDIDITGLMKQVWAKKWLILTIAAIFAGVVFVGSSAVKPRYKTSASILIEKSKSIFAPREGEAGITAELDQDAIGSQVQLLMSDTVAFNVINDLKLTEKPDFSGDAQGSFLSNLFGSKEGEATPQERILKKFKQRLEVYNAQNSRMIIIEFWAHDPKLAQQVADSVAMEYVKLKESEKKGANLRAKEDLQPEIVELKRQVKEAQEKVAEFRANSDLMMGTNNSLLATQQLSEVASELSRIKADRSAAEATVASIRKALKAGTSLDAIPDVIANPLIQRLRERQVTLQAEISDLSTTLLPNHPKLKALQSQVADYDNQIRQTARNILTSVESNVGIARQREADLGSEVSRLKVESARVGGAEVELNALERDAEIKEDQLKSHMTSYGDASSSLKANFTPVSAKIVSTAPLPTEHYFPKVIPFTIAAFVVALIMGMVGVLAWALLTGKALRVVDGALSPEMMPQQLHMAQSGYPQAWQNGQYPGQYPDQYPAYQQAQMAAQHGQNFNNAPMAVDAPGLETPMANGFNYQAAPEPVAMSDFVMAIAAIERARIACVSPGGVTGSTTTVELARQLALNGHGVVVVDMSGSSMLTRTMLGTDQLPGIYEILSGRQIVDNLVYGDQQTSAHVIATGVDPQLADGFAMNRLQAMMATLEANYQFVLVDCGKANIESMVKFGDFSTVVVINGEGSTPEVCARLEIEALQKGYEEVITLGHNAAPQYVQQPLAA